MWILGRALRACAALFVNIRFWSTCFVAAVTLRLLVEGFERATKAGMFWIGPHSLLFEPCDDAAAPEEGGRGLRWRASDDELRHVLCMAARNALGWPVRGPARPRRRLDLSTVIEEGPRPSWGSVGRRSPVGAACRPGERERASRFLPQLERVEEEAAQSMVEAAVEPPCVMMGEEGRPDLADVYDLGIECWGCDLPSRRAEGAVPNLDLRNRFEGLEVEGVEGDEGAPIVLPEADCARPPGRPPGSKTPRRGPRAPKEVRDMESYLLRPVPMRRRSENELVLGAHARFLQHWFRRTRALAAARCARWSDAPAAWSRGGMRGLLPIYRPVHRPRCTDGIASEDDFAAQRRRARRVLMWYRQYAELLQKLLGRQPELVDLFCGEGGVSEGIRRAGLTPTGVDMKDMPRYRNRFGLDRFIVADAYLPDTMRRAIEGCGAVGIGASPPCQPYSTVLADGSTATAAPGLPQVAASLRELGLPFWVENVLGADAGELEEQMTVLRGPMFGLPVDRGRRFWTSFDLHLDEALTEGGRKLRHRCCLGPRRRWMRLDPFGRPIRIPCCRGNLYPVQGRAPTRSSVEENARAMGVDEGHMSWSGLAQSIPPDMAELVAGQLAMNVACQRFGAPRISFDDFEAKPTWARRAMRRWLRGAGDDTRDAGLELVGAAAPEAGGAVDEEVVEPEESDDPRWSPPPEPGGATRRASARALWSDARWGLPESDWRELYYSYAGGYTQSVLEPGAPWWLGAMNLRPPCAPGELTAERLRGENTFLHCSLGGLERCWEEVRLAMGHEERGTRLTVVVPRGGDEVWPARAREAGLLELELDGLGVECAGADVEVPWGSDGLELRALESGYRVFVGGAPRYASAAMTLDHDAAEADMDPRDLGVGCEEPELKAARSYLPIPHDPERWRGKGFSPFVEQLMTEGHRIGGDEPFGFYEIDQYKWRDATAQRMGGLEADRHVLVGALEYVSAAEAATLLKSCATVHPWTVVHQRDKWRACQDYSKGTNVEADTAPFRLPTVFDVRRVVKPDSHFAKWDLRDGFFHVPVHPDSRNRMLVRHPVSGLLMRCLRLPFGYVDSPRCFCAMTEAVAQKFRERVARAGVRAHIFVYVDDALVVGDTEEETRRASRIFEALLAELGLQWAPHKRRGPARVIEFLGMLICNSPRTPRCIGLTRKRQEALRARLDEWLARRPPAGGAEQEIVEPRELAVLLGHLIFASQVMPHGRVYMQGMLASFVGLEVEWRRGAVRARGEVWRAMTIGDGFWRDLDWWDQQLSSNNCVPLAPAPPARAAVQAGTDASDFGAGEVIYLGGQREETRLLFTRAEKRRPINWRELLGILRILEVWGGRLRGSRLLVETDNMVAWTTGSSGHSKAAEMQELLRRLCERCARLEIEMTLTHQPGAKLDRPDQVSRGTAVEEPRVRLNAELYRALARGYGPFTEFLGAEREHATPRAVGDRPPGSGTRCFVHPSFATVGSALRLVGERLRDALPGSFSGLVVLPYAPEAQWWRLLKHFSVVAHIGRHSHTPHLEANSLATWRPLAARRDTLIVAFPRSAGPKTLQVAVDWVERAPEEAGYELCPSLPDFYQREGEEWPGVPRVFALTLPKGAVVYSLPAESGKFGALYLLMESYQPTTEEDAYGPVAVELLRDGRAKSKSVDDRGRVGVLVDSKDSYHRSGAPHRPLATELFVVTHLTERAAVPTSSMRHWDRVTDYFYFDQAAAETEIRRYLARLDDQPVMAPPVYDSSGDDTATTAQAVARRKTGGNQARRGPASDASETVSVIELAHAGPARLDEDGELHLDMVQAGHGGAAAASGNPLDPPPPESQRCTCPRVCFLPREQENPLGRCQLCAGPACRCPGIGDLRGPGGRLCCSSGKEVGPVTASMSRLAMASPSGHAPMCDYPGCEASCKLLDDQSGYARFCTGAVHPPGPRPTCLLAGCPSPCHPTPSFDGWYEFCGHTHGRLHTQRREAAERDLAAGRGAPAGPALSRMASGAGTTQISRSNGITCRGCGLSIRMGTPMEVCDEGFVHPTDDCRARVMASRATGGRDRVVPTATAAATNLQKQAKVKAELSDRRMATVRGCLNGQCALRADPTAVVIPCRGGCGRSLHQRCADISKGYAQKGALLCVDCRLRAMGAEGQPAESLLNEVTQLVVIELTEGREATSSTHSGFVTLTEKWVAEKLAQGVRRIASPTESLESFKQFAKWMVLNADRERSFESTMRAAGGYFTRASKPDFTKVPEVKSLISELKDKISTTPQPRTHGTRRMLVGAYEYVAETHAKKPLLRVRENVSITNEAMGCLRAVESCAAVEKHGLAANDCYILQDLQTGVVSVELKVHDSKTHHPRYVNIAAESTTSKIQVAEMYMELFKVNGLALATQTEGGYKVICPDSWSVRLSLLGMQPGFERQLELALKDYAQYDPKAPPLLKRLILYAVQAHKATTGGTDHKYVLLNEGPLNWEGHDHLIACLVRHGLGAAGQDITKVPAPLLRSTEHSGRLLTPMPQTYDGAHQHMAKAFKAAFEKANPPGDPDPELDRQGHELMKWGQHSWRRLGEKVARDSKETWMAEGVTEKDVDKYSDWNQHEMSQDMQLHYSGEQRSYRVRRCAITRAM